jgi:5'(3')-deoxyribonucleotidase
MSQEQLPENMSEQIARLKKLLQDTKILGIDIDGTLSDTIGAALTELRTRFGEVMDFSQWKTWNPHEIPELQEKWLTTIQHTIDLFYGILRVGWSQVVWPIEGSVEWISRLQSLWKKLIALSGRLEGSRPYTSWWLDEYYPWVFDQVLLTDHDTPNQVPKYELARAHGIWLMIEDNALYAIDLATHGIPTVLLEAPWNKDIDTSAYPDIYRVRDWGEISETLSQSAN